MANANYEFELFYTRDGFNRSLGHFQSVAGLVGTLPDEENLADLLIDEIAEGEIRQNQLSPIVYALLVDKYGYAFGSNNLNTNFDDFESIQQEVVKWKAVDLLGTYIHPELGFLVFNPKNLEHLKGLQTFKKNEIVTLYVGAFDGEVDAKVSAKAIDCFFTILSGKTKKTPPELLKGRFSYKAAAKQKPAAPKAAKSKKSSPGKAKSSAKKAPSEPPSSVEAPVSTGPKKMTPLYSVPVTNELFHNGNVEAWKRVIQSYTTKHPQLEVYIFYDGERIHDINALFKWGKVKHGSSILFAVAGDNIKDVAKLQRYLMQGASPRFEDFLRFPVNTVLNLF